MWCGRERRRIQGFEPIQRVGVYLDREEEDNKRNMQQKGLRNLKGYGASLNATNSAATTERVNCNLRWMNKKYIGKYFWTTFKGYQYQGFVRNIGWCSKRGYAAKVSYADGYTEWLQLRRLENLLEQDTNYEREIVEHCRMARVVQDDNRRNVQHSESIRQREKRQEGLLHERFIGVTFEKSFGKFGIFVGVVREVWRHDNGEYIAKVVYDDDDVEDISVGELERLLNEINAVEMLRRQTRCEEEDLQVGNEHTAGVDFSVGVNHERVSLPKETVNYQEFPTFVFKQEDVAEKSVTVQVFENNSLPNVLDLSRKAVAGPPGIVEPESLVFHGHSLLDDNDNILKPDTPSPLEQSNKCVGLDYSFKQTNARVRTGNLLLHDIWAFAKTFVSSVMVPTFLANKTNRVAFLRAIVFLALIFAGWDPPKHAV